jgi:hypothetical protein
MKKWLMILSISLLILYSFAPAAQAQCSICTKTAQQMGEKPAKGMNFGILYLAAAPLILLGVIGFKWYRHNKD